MTVRKSLAAASLDGKVLTVEDLRKHLGLGVEPNEGSSAAVVQNTAPQVLLIGHDLCNDLKAMKQEGIQLATFFRYGGCADTLVLFEDASKSRTSLSKLVEHYDLVECHMSKPKRKKKKLIFIGAHNAGNDAIATLKVLLAQVLDMKGPDVETDRCNKPLTGINQNMIFLAYDTETVEVPTYKPNKSNRTTEHGFAYLKLADVADIGPGRLGENWHSHVKARHWINNDWRGWENKIFLVGNRDGFWPQFGKSGYYWTQESPAPFHSFFQELAQRNSTHVDSPQVASGSVSTADAALLPTATATAHSKGVASASVAQPVLRNSSQKAKTSTKDSQNIRSGNSGAHKGVMAPASNTKPQGITKSQSRNRRRKLARQSQRAMLAAGATVKGDSATQ